MRPWVLPVLLLVTVSTAIAAAYTRHESRKLFVELQELEASRDDMNIEWGQLQLEQSTYTTNGEIERAALSRLDMETPEPNQVVMIRP